jgi:CHASE2 domain-containing sensor protein
MEYSNPCYWDSALHADFIEEISEAEAESILQSIYKAETEEDSKEVLRAIQQKMELYTVECEGEG